MKNKLPQGELGQTDLFGEPKRIDEISTAPARPKSKPAVQPIPQPQTQSSLQIRTEQFHDRLLKIVGQILQLRITRNKTSMVSFGRRSGILVIRLHIAFLDAPEAILRDLAEWVKQPRKGTPESVRNFANSIEHPPPAESRRLLYTRTTANVHDLRAIYEAVNREHFEGKITARITYGRDNSRQKVGSRRLGSYSRRENLITIHPLFDDPVVPEFVVAFTVFHEMLHALQPEGHKRPHDKAFRAEESKHPDYKRVKDWQKKNDRFLRGGSRGKKRKTES